MALTDTPVTSDDLTATGTTHESATTTHAFSPAAGAMVLVRLSWLQAGGGTPTTITVADSHGNSYTSQLQAANSFNVAGSAIFYHVYPAAPGSTTLTVTSSAASAATGGTAFLVSPSVVTGQGAVPSFGPNVINIAPSGSTTTLVTNLVTTAAGSQVYLAGGCESGSAGTVNANTTQTASFASFNNAFTGLGKTQTGTPGSTAFGWTVSPAALFGGNLIGVELLPDSGTPGGRSQFTWPFSWDSIWNLPISADAEYAPTGITVDSDFSTDPTAVEYCCTDPAQPVKVLQNALLAGGSTGHANVYVAPAMAAAGVFNDCAAFLGSADNDTVYQGQTLQLTAGGNPQFGGTGDFPSAPVSITGDGITGAHGGSGLSALGGTLTTADLTGSDPIRHAMKVCFNGFEYYSHAGAGFQWPAVSADDGFDDSGDPNFYGGSNPAIVLGALLALPPFVSPSKYSDPLVAKIATAMQCYGAYIVDNTASGAGVSDSIILLNYDAAAHFTGSGTFSDDFHQLLEDLQVVTTSAEATPGGGAIGSDRFAAYATAFTDGTGAPDAVTVVTPGSVLMESLTDAFPGTTLNAQWGSYGTVAVTGGHVAIDAITAESGIFSNATWTLTGSHMLAKVTPYTGGSSPYAYFQAALESGGGAGIQYNAGTLFAYTTDSGGTVTSLTPVTYNATTHAWWRVRESGGTTFFDTSPDGAAWTNRWSAPNPVSYAAMLAQCGSGIGSGTPGNTVLASFNVPPGTARTATAGLTVTPVLSAAPARGQSRTAALTVTPILSATVPARQSASAALTVTPVLSAARTASFTRSAGLTVTPVLSAAPVHGSFRTAAFTVTPVLTAAAVTHPGPPPGYPDGALAARVELLLGGAWTDLTAQALPDGQQYGSIKSGQGDGSTQPTPGAMNGTWDNPDYSLSPRNAAGPYFGQLRQNTPARVSVESPYGAYLRLEAGDSDRAFVDDTAALHVAGSMELRLEALPSDYRGCVLAARYDGTEPSWYWLLDRAGTFTFSWFDAAGTQHSVTSPVAASVSWRAFRVTLDATSGDVEFFVSTDIDGTWTSLGDAASGTGGAATTVQAGNAPLVVGWSASLPGSQMSGQVSGFRLYDGTGGSKVADAAFSIQVPGVTAWTDLAGLTWSTAGGAELTARDYRLHGELASLAPTAHQSSSLPRLAAQLSGRMRRLQQGYAPQLDSPMRRAVLSQPGSLYPVDYWTMEDGQLATAFGPAVGSQFLNSLLGKVKPAADSSFEASAPLPTLNGDQLSFTVDSYTGASAWAVRFLYKKGSTLPASGTSARLVELATTGACTTVTMSVNDSGNIDFAGQLANGTSAFSFTNVAYPELTGGWWSLEATVSGSGVLYALVAVAPGAGSGSSESQVVTGHGSFGTVTSGTVNADLVLTDTVFGHLSVQKAWASMFTLGAPLNAWRTELTADRFARVCAQQGITCRIVGRPATSQAMGPQPRGSAWTVLLDCASTEQGMLFEPSGCFGLGLRTAEALGSQSAAVTLDFAAANLRGDLQPVDDDSGFLNDLTIAMPGGTQYRVTLDDGSPNSVSEPADGGRGAYTGQPPFTFNLAGASQLAANARLYLARASVDEPRYRNMAADFGIPGAPVKDMARLRPGDLVKITSVPAIYQTADIQQLVTGATESFGPGRVITWNGVPASPYTGTGGGAAVSPDAILDTDGAAILDTDGVAILDTGA